MTSDRFTSFFQAFGSGGIDRFCGVWMGVGLSFKIDENPIKNGIHFRKTAIFIGFTVKSKD